MALPRIEDSPLFQPWIDPASGITSWILTQRAAPLQQSFYFMNRSLSADGRYLWFYCAHPPGGSAEIARSLGVADLHEGTVACFPETLFRDGSPWIDPATGQAYWCWEYAVHRRGPLPDATVERVNGLPESLHRNRYGKRLATHLTRSADGREFFIDAHLGREWCLGSLPVDGGPFQVWQTLDRCYNHAQFSPTDPDLALVAQDWWTDVATGEYRPYDNRLWLIRRGGTVAPLTTAATSIAHEWWDPDGRHVWYVDYQRGTERIDVQTLARTSVWPGGTCHSHSSADGRLVVGDIGTYSWAKTGCRVACFNAATGREVDIVSRLPLPPLPRGAYHIDPHPQFCADDGLVAYTTTVLGRVDVALVRTADLLRATA